MLIQQIVKVTDSSLQCPHCEYKELPWDDTVYEDGMLVYPQVCPDCGQEFIEYCTDPEDIYLYTTYIKYIRGENSNMRW